MSFELPENYKDNIHDIIERCYDLIDIGYFDKFDKSVITRQEAIIDSMTKEEKRYPKIMNASRKTRVAKGAGVTVQDINKLLKQFLEMQKMMKKVGKFDEKNLRNFGNMLDNKYKNKIL